MGVVVVASFAISAANLFENLWCAFSQCLPCFVQSFLLSNIVPEFSACLLLQETTRRVSIPDLVHNYLGEFALLGLGTLDIVQLVFPNERPEVLVSRMVIDEVTSS